MMADDHDDDDDDAPGRRITRDGEGAPSQSRASITLS